jgi:hypothetical protein
MRRIIIIGTAIAVLVGAASAYAALNTYTANVTVAGGAGSPKSPVPVAVTEHYGATNVTAGLVAAPLVDIKTTIYGLQSNAGKFPTCNGNTISVRKDDTFCPAKALIATGSVHAELGSPSLKATGAIPCNPFLHAWNGGPGTAWFFFLTSSQHLCATLHTGDTQAYPATISQQGKNLVINLPLPSYISTAVAHHPGLYGSLITETLSYRKVTTRVNGKTVGYISSVGCLHGKRPWKVQFTAVSGSTKETKTVSGSAPC